MTQEDLRELFAEFGEVTSVKIIEDRETGRPKGFGFVEMADNTAGQNAIDGLNEKDIMGRGIKVNEARPREDRPRDDRPRRRPTNRY